jgi:soluble P-type ATPase
MLACARPGGTSTHGRLIAGLVLAQWPVPHSLARARCRHASSACIIKRMIELAIPGRGQLRLQHLVTDVNGTLAVDGMLIEGIAKRVASLRDRLTVHLLTADTHGSQAAIDRQLNLVGTRLAAGDEQAQKRQFVENLGPETVVAIGQGANDALMLKAASIGICVMSAEGAAAETMMAADIIVPNIFAALDLLDKPLRIVASLRT